MQDPCHVLSDKDNAGLSAASFSWLTERAVIAQLQFESRAIQVLNNICIKDIGKPKNVMKREKKNLFQQNSVSLRMKDADCVY